MLHAKLEQARIIGQIQGCYNNANKLIRPTINQIDFENAVKEDGVKFFFPDVIKGYADQSLQEVEKEQDDLKKSEIVEKSTKELKPLQLIDIVFNKVTQPLYVDVIDTETGTYKDNSINRLLNRVGQAV